LQTYTVAGAVTVNKSLFFLTYMTSGSEFIEMRVQM